MARKPFDWRKAYERQHGPLPTAETIVAIRPEPGVTAEPSPPAAPLVAVAEAEAPPAPAPANDDATPKRSGIIPDLEEPAVAGGRKDGVVLNLKCELAPPARRARARRGNRPCVACEATGRPPSVIGEGVLAGWRVVTRQCRCYRAVVWTVVAGREAA